MESQPTVGTALWPQAAWLVGRKELVGPGFHSGREEGVFHTALVSPGPHWSTGTSCHNTL